VPTDVPAQDRLRIVVETSDERIGMLGVTLPTLPATDVGRIYLRSSETLAGRCVGKGQVPIGSVSLALRPYGELKPRTHAIASAQADDTGYFEFKKIPRGLYALTGRGPKGELFVETGVVVPHFKPLIVQARKAEPLRFTVRNTMNEPISSASVVARLRGPEATREPLSEHLVVPAIHATTDAEGEAITSPALAGRYDAQLLYLGTRYDFTIDRSPARLIIPTDPRVLVRFMHEGKPLRKVKLSTAQGRYTTDADGIVAFARGSPPYFRIGANSDLLRLVGQGALAHDKIKEGQISLTIRMERETPDAGGGSRDQAGGRERRVCVTYPDGRPVVGARVHGGIKIVRTGEDGWADVGFVSEEGRLRLERPDLASGFPQSLKLGDLARVFFHWNAGRRVRIKITDRRFGFPVDSNVSIGILPTAWKRVAPGVFEGLWDFENAPDDALITIRAEGYEPVILDPPHSLGPTVVHEVAIRRPGITGKRLVILEVLKNGIGVPGALVDARLIGKHDGNKPGRGQVHALSKDKGLVILRDLQEGRWLLRADGGWGGWGQTLVNVGKGSAEVRLPLTWPPSITGKVIERGGRPVAGARVSVEGSRIARSRRDGRFAINRTGRRARAIQFKASKPGYGDSTATWMMIQGVYKKRPLTLDPVRRFAVPIEWEDAGGDPIPQDLVCKLRDGSTSILEESEFVFHIARTPRGWLRQLHGSAVVQVGSRRGKRRAVILQRGARIEGTVQGAGAGVLVSALVRRTRTMVTRTKEGGHFVIEGVPPGDVTLEVEGQTPESRVRNANLRAVDRTVLTVEVER
jgi:hypothetical protein